MLSSGLLVYKLGGVGVRVGGVTATGDEQVEYAESIEDLEEELRHMDGPAPVVAIGLLSRLLVGESDLGQDGHWDLQVRGLVEAALLRGWYACADEPLLELQALARQLTTLESEDSLEQALAPLLRCSDSRVAKPAQRYLDSRPSERASVALILRDRVGRELERRGITCSDVYAAATTELQVESA